jgi:tetratricopeptide (TPR) repeat protein
VGAQGKIVLIQGHVDSALAASQDRWNPAQLLQPLYVSDRVRTLTASRSAILLIDETQVKLNAGAVLTVQQIKTTGGTSTTLNLLEGEGWFRTKNPSSGLTIRTPRAAAAIRGTEINILVRDNDALLTVSEGAAEFSNDAGSILVNAGEEATATPGQAPTKRTLLNPEDAVQWVLYYPTRIAWHDLPLSTLIGAAAAGFDRLQAGDSVAALAAFQPSIQGDPWARVGAAIAARQLGDATRARTLLTEASFTGDVEIERRTELAAAALAIGDAAAARTELQNVLSSAPTALRPLVMLSELELTQNRAPEAARLAQRAIDAHPDSVAAHVAAAEAAQAAFDLERARRELDAAIAIDSGDLRALVNRARLRFGVGDTAAARSDAGRVAAIAPNDASLRSLLGFIELASGQLEAARAHFDAAIGADPALGEPHLGLGLVDFRSGFYDNGLLELLTATLLEPKVSLFQSYLGKAYYQLGRFPEGLAALASAKRLDPRDPTPWLYTSFFLRDQHQHVGALDELRQAIALNDNRAVYRSRLLLDRDLATKNVSLAKLYNQLGFDAWGAYEAVNSLNADLSNASAHLFMSDTYGRLPDRSQALSSELDQYFVYAPVNLNSFNNFSEYTSLLERPLKQFTLTQGFGDRGQSSTVVRTQSGNSRFAHTAFVAYDGRDSVRPLENDYRIQGTAFMKLAFGPSSDLFATLTGVKQDKGKDNDSIVSIGEFPYQVSVSQIVEHPDPTFTELRDVASATVGYKQFWTPASVLTVKADASHISSTFEDPDASFAACPQALGIADLSPLFAHSDSRYSLPFAGVSLQAQQANRLRRHQLLFGGDYTRRRKRLRCHDFVTSSVYSGSLTADEDLTATETTAGAWVRDDIEITSRLHVTVGARYVVGQYGEPRRESDYDFHRLNPHAGVSIRLSPTVTVHAAGFRNTNSDFLSSSLAPPTVASFVLQRNELPTAKRDEVGVAVQNAWRRTFVEVRAFARKTVAPAFQVAPDDPNPLFAEYADYLTPPDADFKAQGIGVFFNQVLTRRFGVFADEQFVMRDAALVNRHDNLLRVGASFTHPAGITARVATRFFTQRFVDTLVQGLPEDTFVLSDAEVVYEFARKHGLLTWSVRNLGNNGFRTIIEDLAVESPLPYRSMMLSLRWRL